MVGTMRRSYTANYSDQVDPLGARDPPGSRFGWVLRELQLILK